MFQSKFIQLFFISFILFCSCESNGQSNSGDTKTSVSVIQNDTIALLQDSLYLGLTYLEITSKSTDEILIFCENSDHTLTDYLISQMKAESDYAEMKVILLREERKRNYEEVDRKLGIK